MATAIVGDDADLKRRVGLHRDRRPDGWGTLETGSLNEVLEADIDRYFAPLKTELELP